LNPAKYRRLRVGMSAVFATAVLISPVSALAANNAASGTNSLTTTFQLPSTVSLPTPPTLQAQSVVLMDADNGQILYEKDPNARRAPASTTKLMTMLLTFKAVQEGKAFWSDIVPVTKDAYQLAQTGGVSDAYLDPRQQLTLDKMMRFIAVLSANDATVAVADKIGGDKMAFVQMMNEEAQKLGLSGTHYMNPDGLPQSDHYTTAHDLAVLARYLVESYPEVTSYTSRAETSQTSFITNKTSTWPNTDELIGKYPGLDGLKTGYTSEAGYCFVGTAERNGVRLISVVMGDPTNASRFTDSRALLDYGFNQFAEKKVISAGQAVVSHTANVKNGKLTHLPVTVQNDLMFDLPSGTAGSVRYQFDSNVSAPVKKGQQVGQAQYLVDNQVIASDALLAAQDDNKANMFTLLWRNVENWFSHLLHRL
jgi:serine-type D-Ala-D-Ala carboxypeptidase (penicillin-binding protein 5/6)